MEELGREIMVFAAVRGERSVNGKKVLIDSCILDGLRIWRASREGESWC
jgi:hypothetical protein